MLVKGCRCFSGSLFSFVFVVSLSLLDLFALLSALFLSLLPLLLPSLLLSLDPSLTLFLSLRAPVLFSHLLSFTSSLLRVILFDEDDDRWGWS